MNNRGKCSGLALILILIAALIFASLVVKQLGSLGVGETTQHGQTQQNAVQQAQDVVDAINAQMQQSVPVGGE